MNFIFNNVSPIFTFLICDMKAQRPNVKKKKKRQVPFYGFQSLPLGFCFFKYFVDIKKLSCIRNGITSVCFALSLLKGHLVHVNRYGSCRSFWLKVWWTGQGYPAWIMFSRQFFQQLAPTSLQFMVLFKSFLFPSTVNIKEASRPCTFLWPKLHWT